MRNPVIKSLFGVTSSLVVASTFVPSALANTQVSAEFRTAISVDGHILSNPMAVVAKDGTTLTTYMPIWYIDQALKAAGYQAAWNPSSQTLSLQSTVAGNSYTQVALGTGHAQIDVNGVPIKKFNDIVVKDPVGGAQAQNTVYVPIYYLNQVLQSVEDSCTWNGKDWNIQSWAGGIQLQGMTQTAPAPHPQSVAVGADDQLMVSATKGGTIGIPWSQVSYSMQGPAGASIDPEGNFTATTPGQYTIHVSFGKAQSSLTIDVFGQPAGIDVQPSFPTLTADGKSTDAITVKVVDKNGFTVSNFNGFVQLSINAAGGTLTNHGTVQIHNGVGSTLLTAPSTLPNQYQVISSSNLASLGTMVPANIQYGMGTVGYNPAN